VFVERLTAPGVRVRLVICLEAPGKLAKSFPPLVTRNADTIEIPRIRDRMDELPVILDDWFVEHRSPLRFRDLVPDVQRRLRSNRWRENLQELLEAAFHLTVLAQYDSEREAERDQTFTRSKSRHWRAKMNIPLPITPKKTLETASPKKVKR
jgi:DNA-binding NtrC family response regulator